MSNMKVVMAAFIYVPGIILYVSNDCVYISIYICINTLSSIFDSDAPKECVHTYIYMHIHMHSYMYICTYIYIYI